MILRATMDRPSTLSMEVFPDDRLQDANNLKVMRPHC